MKYNWHFWTAGMKEILCTILKIIINIQVKKYILVQEKNVAWGNYEVFINL
jgi:hypothetical protein